MRNVRHDRIGSCRFQGREPFTRLYLPLTLSLPPLIQSLVCPPPPSPLIFYSSSLRFHPLLPAPTVIQTWRVLSSPIPFPTNSTRADSGGTVVGMSGRDGARGYPCAIDGHMATSSPGIHRVQTGLFERGELITRP